MALNERIWRWSLSACSIVVTLATETLTTETWIVRVAHWQSRLHWLVYHSLLSIKCLGNYALSGVWVCNRACCLGNQLRYTTSLQALDISSWSYIMYCLLPDYEGRGRGQGRAKWSLTCPLHRLGKVGPELHDSRQVSTLTRTLHNERASEKR